MKKILIGAVALAVLVSPSLAIAASNDVSLTTDTVLTVGGIDLNVAGSTAALESIEMADSGNSFTVVLSSGSSFKITSADRRVLTTDAPAKYILTDSCSSSVSTLELASYSGTVTIVITPTSTICTITTAQATSGTGRGSSGGGAVTTKKVVAPVVKTATPVATQASATAKVAAAGSNAKFTRALKVGSAGNDVKQLQQFLNANGFTVASSGVGSPGKETTYMGKLTQKAIKKFQVKYGIVSSGTPETTGYGNLGPKTRAKLNELMGR
ncbi:MAG: peptidoglycan-binding domain-containing protein [Patescibacteria group bacterium]|mgnify:CR=1 FL=1